MSRPDANVSRLETELAREKRAREDAERAGEASLRELLELKQALKHEEAVRGRHASERITEASSLQDALIELDRLRQQDRWLQRQNQLVIDILQTLGSLIQPETAPMAALGIMADALGTTCAGLLPEAGEADDEVFVTTHSDWWDRFIEEGSLHRYLQNRPIRVITRLDSLPFGKEILRQWPGDPIDLLASARVETGEKRFLLILGGSSRLAAHQELRLLLPRFAALLADALNRRTASLHRKHIEAELAQARRMEALGSLASGVAHEMNTPMQYISDNLHFLNEAATGLIVALDQFSGVIRDLGHGATADEILAKADYAFMRAEIPSAIEQSIWGTRRLSDIIKAIKTFSYADASGKEDFELADVIDNCLVVSRRMWSSVADMQVKSDGRAKQIRGDSVQLSQAMIALISNACEAIRSKPGWHGRQHSDRIRITMELVGDEVRIMLDDTGPGIPEDLRARIFDPFFTTKSVGRGIGQGLNQCRHIIAKGFGGRMEVGDSPLGGARFSLWLPLAPAGE